MALHGVFANDLQFGKGVDSDQAQDDEREQADVDDADLEEGEIADDDEAELQPEDKKPTEEKGAEIKSTAPKGDVKKEDLKMGTLVQSERSDSGNYKSVGGANSEKRRDRRVAANNSRNTRKRTGEDDVSSHLRDSHRKRRRTHDGDNDEVEDGDYDIMNARGHSPMERLQRYGGGGESAGSDYEDNNVNPVRRQRGGERLRPGRSSPPRRRPQSGNSRDRGSDRRRQDRDRSERDRRPGKNNSSASNTSSNKLKDESICAFYMEGKCSRGNDCPYSHAALPPRKMELCKFYLMDCCAKKEKCLYLHKDFPCKFFHTGKKCRHSAEECKFSHDSLSETMRAILIKHIETAPREILGDFPRLTREETIQAIDHFSPPSNGREKRPHIPALFDQANSADGRTSSGSTNKTDAKDTGRHHHQQQQQTTDRNDDCPPSSTRRAGFYQDTAVTTSDTEHGRGEQPEENSRSIWFGQLRQEMTNDRNSHNPNPVDQPLRDEHSRQKTEEVHLRSPVGTGTIAATTATPLTKEDDHQTVDYLSMLPARQRQLYRRIQQQQREPASIQEEDPSDQKNPMDEKWYSSDEEENGESISDLLKSIKQKPEIPVDNKQSNSGPALSAHLNLSSLENINVAEIAKALSSLQQSQSDSGGSSTAADNSRRDPRTRDPRVRTGGSQGPAHMTMGISNTGCDVDLRVPPTGSRHDVDLRLDNRMTGDVDLRSGLVPPLGNLDDIGSSSDIDLRRFSIPFKSTVHPAQPFREIEASTTCRPPMEYQVWLVDYVPLDYSLIRVQADWAHLDPRQQKASLGVRDFTNSDPPSIPLGPASPDPVGPVNPSLSPAPAPIIRHYEPEPATYSPMRSAPNDPRARDPRRAGATQTHTTAGLADKRGITVGGVGLLGAAPPGMLPLLSNKGNAAGSIQGGDPSLQEAPYANFRSVNTPPYVVDRNVVDDPSREQRQVENRRDPRQRHKNPANVVDSSERSYTPPPNERVFR